MTRLSKHFDRSEFACKCGCGFDVVDVQLLEMLEDIRERFMKPVKINSACRCPEHNKAVGGSPTSQHLLGKAADIVVSDEQPGFIGNYVDAKREDSFGIGVYETFTHIDCRDGKARWAG